MSRIPTAQEWRENPEAALAASLEIAKVTSAHGDPSTQAIVLGIAAQAIAAAAPIVGAAIGGPGGAIAGAAIAQLADHLGNQSAASLNTLTTDQQALVSQTITLGAGALAKGLAR